MAKGIRTKKECGLELIHSLVVQPGSKVFPQSDTPIPDGVTVRSGKGVQIEFMYKGVRRTETISGIPTVAHVLKADAVRKRVIQAIGLQYFDYAREFPDSRNVVNKDTPSSLVTVATVGEALDEWLGTMRNTVGENAFIDYTKDIKGRLKTAPITALDLVGARHAIQRTGFLAELPANLLSDANINNLRSSLIAEGLSVKRVMNILTPLRGAMARLAKSGAIPFNPFERVRPLKRKKVRSEQSVFTTVIPFAPLSIEDVACFQEDDDRPDPFTPDEVSSFLRFMPEPFNHLVKFWIWTGLRTGELIALQWTDIDWKNKKICVRNSLSRGIYKETKSDRIRWVNLPPLAQQALTAQFEHTGQNGSLVFPNPYTGSRWANESKICSRFKKALALAGVRYRRPYHCRHTYASTLLSAGENPLYVAEQLGHRDWGMIVKHYGRWMPTVDTQAGQRVASLHPGEWGIPQSTDAQQPLGSDAGVAPDAGVGENMGSRTILANATLKSDKQNID